MQLKNRIVSSRALKAFLLFTAFILLAGLIKFFLVIPLSEKPYPLAKRPLNIGHRGGMDLWPENSIYGFKKALDIGVDILELDVRESSDGEIVVIHDETVERTSNGTGRVDSLTLSELRELDFAQRHELRGSGITISSLEELFDAFPDAYFNIEIKPEDDLLAEKVIRLLREKGVVKRVVITSFHNSVMKAIRLKAPDIATAASQAEVKEMYILALLGLGRLHQPVGSSYQIPLIHKGTTVATPGFMRAAHSVGQEVYVWTIDDEAQMKNLLEMGVDGIITSRPDILAGILSESGK